MAEKTTAKTKTRSLKATLRSTQSATKEGHAHPSATNVTPEEQQLIREHADALSKTTKRAKWIHSPEEHEDHPGQSLATRNHEVIMRWAQERNAQPATVTGTEYGDRPGVLRFIFPSFGGERLQSVSWEDWFKTFDERQLVFVFQEHKSDGAMSNFFTLDSPEREKG